MTNKEDSDGMWVQTQVMWVWVVLERYKEDPFDIRSVHASQASADAHIRELTRDESPWEEQHRHFAVQAWDVRP